MADKLQKIKILNDNYLNTIYAIVGFMNIYKFELKKSRNIDVKLFQGRKLNIGENDEKFVTPDIGILIDEKSGVIGEVKNNFSKDYSNYDEAFKQLLNYDADLIGWPIDGETETIPSFDIILLVHDSQSRKVRDYYIKKSNEDLKFIRPFIIIEYHRSDEAKQFFTFRIEHGTLSEKEIHQKLYDGLPIPMDVLLIQYSKIKIYDSQPPLSWMMFLIHQCMMDKATAEGKYIRLNKKTKIKLETSFNEVSELLYSTYSFSSFHANHPERQQKFPQKEWVKEAINKFESIKEVSWKDEKHEEFVFDLQRHEDAKTHYEEKCLDESDSSQTTLF